MLLLECNTFGSISAIGLQQPPADLTLFYTGVIAQDKAWPAACQRSKELPGGWERTRGDPPPHAAQVCKPYNPQGLDACTKTDPLTRRAGMVSGPEVGLSQILGKQQNRLTWKLH